MAGSDEPKHMHSLAGAIVFSIHKRELYKVHLVSLDGCKNGITHTVCDIMDLLLAEIAFFADKGRVFLDIMIN